MLEDLIYFFSSVVPCLVEGLWSPRNACNIFICLVDEPYYLFNFYWMVGLRHFSLFLFLQIIDVLEFIPSHVAVWFLSNMCVRVCVHSQVDAWLYKHVIVCLPKSCFIRMFVLLKDSCFAYSFFLPIKKKKYFFYRFHLLSDFAYIILMGFP